MISTLEMLEGQARGNSPRLFSWNFPRVDYVFTSADYLTVEFRKDYNPEFAYYHNGVRIERDRALELLPLEVEKEWPEFDGGDFGTYF